MKVNNMIKKSKLNIIVVVLIIISLFLSACQSIERLENTADFSADNSDVNEQKYAKLLMAIDAEMKILEPKISLDYLFSDDDNQQMLTAIKEHILALSPNPLLSYKIQLSNKGKIYHLDLSLEYRDFYIYQNLTKAKNPSDYVKYQAIAEQINEFIAENTNEQMSDFEKEVVIFDYLVKNFTYDESLDNYTINSMFTTGKGICQAYAELFYLYASKMGLDVELITGDATFYGALESRPHAWNLIKLDDDYYHVDATWGELVKLKNETLVDYSYFNLNDSQMSKTHHWKQEDYPKCTQNQYNYYIHKNLVASSEAELIEIINNNQSKVYTILLNFQYDDFDSLLQDLCTNLGTDKIKYSLKNSVLYVELLE